MLITMKCKEKHATTLNLQEYRTAHCALRRASCGPSCATRSVSPAMAGVVDLLRVPYNPKSLTHNN